MSNLIKQRVRFVDYENKSALVLNRKNKVIVSNPQRPLDKGVELSRFEFFCQKLVPYVVAIAVFVLIVLVLVAMLKYGHNITGTEANSFYYHLGDL